MIKNLLNADEDPPEGTKVIIEDTVVNAPPPTSPESASFAAAETPAPADAAAPAQFEIPADAQFFAKPPEAPAQTAPLDENAESLTALMAEIENLSPEEFDRLEREMDLAAESAPRAAPAVEPAVEAVADAPSEAEKAPFETPVQKIEVESAPTIFQSDYTPPTTGQTIRNSGLAWSAGVVLFGSVIFMMIFGWFADLLFGSSPFGIIGGIILGGIIGFIQLFRITSQIYKK